MTNRFFKKKAEECGFPEKKRIFFIFSLEILEFGLILLGYNRRERFFL